MCWLYVPGLEVWSLESELPSRTVELSVLSKKTVSPRPLSWRGWRTRPWLAFLSGALLNPSLATSTAERWMSSRRAFLASPSLWPESVLDEKTTNGSGPTLRASFATYDPLSSSWKTSQACLFEVEALETFSESWPPSGSMRSGRVFERSTSAHPTFGVGSSYWPGVTSSPYGSSQNEGAVSHDRPSRSTPSLNQLANRWPTATSRDFNSNGARSKTETSHSGTTLTEAIRDDGHHPRVGPDDGQAVLNPAFDEWLMGFPIGWTDVERSAMQSYLRWRRKHFTSFSTER